MPRRSSNETINALELAIETHVAARIRLRRGLQGMSQMNVAKRLGITFQQFQKYERGSNRVSTAKLYRLSEILDVPMTYFFDGLDAPDMRRPSVDYSESATASAPMLSRKELDLLRLWRAAPNSIADEVSGLLRAVEAGRSVPVMPAPHVNPTSDALEARVRAADEFVPGSSAGAADVQPVDDEPPVKQRRRGGRPLGSKNRPKATAPAPVASKVWSPRDIWRR